MTQALAIAAGGAIGALLRYWASTGVHAWLGRGFPYGTLFVNVLGSLLMGFLFVDPMTGAMYGFPEHVAVELEASGSALSDARAPESSSQVPGPSMRTGPLNLGDHTMAGSRRVRR